MAPQSSVHRLPPDLPSSPPTYEMLADCVMRMRAASQIRAKSPEDPYRVRTALAYILITATVFVIRASIEVGPGPAVLLTACGIVCLMVFYREIGRYADRRWEQRAARIFEGESQAKATLDSLSDPACLPAILDNRFGGSSGLREPPPELYPLLERILPLVEGCDYAQMSSDHRLTLHRLLLNCSPASNPQLALHILRLIALAEDTYAAPFVRMLSAMPGNTEASARVKAEALTVLACLDAATRRHQAAGRLLRSASNPEGTLLRPASGAGEDSPTLLLRPGSAD